ncbi:MAG: tRNA (guanosine(46)-N7)-methyltransferase TrmB [Flavobacteriales bacterium]|jgi:tRNA (guanine-N7-)-methyltransferase|nr:tRNA (guanosine(46)-N7)-methyltransferase TrmB [Flavobacteriales bacterium]
MGKKKLIRFQDMKTMDCVFEPDMKTCLEDSFPLKGKWRSDYFKNDKPLIIELGCGKGEYTVQLAKQYPNKNYVGLDIKGSRIWYGADEVRREGMNNVGFVRTKVDFVEKFFAPGEVDEIWLTFSDPQPKKPRKRLSSELFVDRYRKILKSDGIVHLKTDNSMLFDYTLEQIEEHNYQLMESTWDLYGEEMEKLDKETQDILGIKTHYEVMFEEKGFDIKYCKFSI